MAIVQVIYTTHVYKSNTTFKVTFLYDLDLI